MKRLIMLSLAALLAVIMLSPSAQAEHARLDHAQALTREAASSGGEFVLDWYTVDGGGVTTSTGDIYTLGGTIGQADASLLSSESYSVQGGFWSLVNGYGIYVPLTRR